MTRPTLSTAAHTARAHLLSAHDDLNCAAWHNAPGFAPLALERIEAAQDAMTNALHGLPVFRSVRSKHHIVTSYEHPPGPCAPFWTAHDDRLGADGSPYGQGRTEAEAIADLQWKLEDLDQ
jgi:hypothetical protein